MQQVILNVLVAKHIEKRKKKTINNKKWIFSIAVQLKMCEQQHTMKIKHSKVSEQNRTNQNIQDKHIKFKFQAILYINAKKKQTNKIDFLEKEKKKNTTKTKQISLL